MTRSVANLFLVLLLFALAPDLGLAQSATVKGTLHLRVLDPSGAVYPDAFVLVRGVADKTGQIVRLNSNGEFDLQLTWGAYDVFAGALECLPFAKRIEIRPVKTTKLEIKFRFDPETKVIY